MEIRRRYAPIRALDDEWLALLKIVGIAVTRRSDSWVSYDGRVLNIAPDDELDDDDCIAQIVLHELCHHFVEGPASMMKPDWGLDNMDARHEAHEHAALRLQAAVLDRYGLRDVLVPTTDFRPYYEQLGVNPLQVHAGGDRSVEAMAREGLERFDASELRALIDARLERVVASAAELLHCE